MVLNDTPHSLSTPSHKALAEDARRRGKTKIEKPAKPKGPTIAERVNVLGEALATGRLLRLDKGSNRPKWTFDDTNRAVSSSLVNRLLASKNLAPAGGGMFPDQGQLWGWVDADPS